MIARINGEQVTIKDGISIAGVLKARGVDPKVVVVEHNMKILRPEEWPGIVLKADDTLEIVSFVGGG